MLGSSSTTSSRASGLRVPDADGLVLVADTTPPDGPCTGAVVMLRGSDVRLHLRWTLPVRTLGVPSSGGAHAPASAPRSAPRSLALAAMPPWLSAGGGHRAAPPPVPDRVVLATAQPPPPPQVGPYR